VPLKEGEVSLWQGRARIGTRNRPRQPSGKPLFEPDRPLAQAGQPSHLGGPRRPLPAH